MLVRTNKFKRAVPYVVIVFLCAGIIIFAFAADQSKAMSGKQNESKEMKHKESMHEEMMEHKKMMPMMCPMHTMMAEKMMGKEIVAMPDGDVVVMAGNKLYKYDKDFNLIKEVELKAAADMKEKMEEMQKECMEKCQGMKMKEKGKTGPM